MCLCVLKRPKIGISLTVNQDDTNIIAIRFIDEV
jgi:hypothetical protein